MTQKEKKIDRAHRFYNSAIDALGIKWAMRFGLVGFFVSLMAAHLTIDMVHFSVNLLLVLVTFFVFAPLFLEAWGRTPEFKAALQARLDGD